MSVQNVKKVRMKEVKYRKVGKIRKLKFFILKSIVTSMLFYILLSFIIADMIDFSGILDFFVLFLILFVASFIIDILGYMVALFFIPEGHSRKTVTKYQFRRFFFFLFRSLIMSFGLGLYMYISTFIFGGAEIWHVLVVWVFITILLYLISEILADRLVG